MRIQHNIMAMGAYRNYTNNTNALKKNLEKLSSGYKINRAGDDAAGLAISEKMRAQITGLEVAQKNAKDGISLIQTAEGALTEVHDMLNRMYALAEQSANGTYDNEVDRQQLQKEIDSLNTEINRIADSSNFNGIKLLNGDLATQSASALGGSSATVLDSKDGSAPTKAGAAEITVKLKDGSATAAKALDGTAKDGSSVIAGTKAELTIKMGGLTSNLTTATYTPKEYTMKVGGQAFNIASTNTSVAAQAQAWADKFNADTNFNATFVATAAADGKISIADKNASTTYTDANAFFAALNGVSGSSFPSTAPATGVTYTGGTGSGAATATFDAAALLEPTSATVTAGKVTGLDLSTWATGDKLELSDGTKTYTYEYSATLNSVSTLQSAIEADGFKFTDNSASSDGSNVDIENEAATITGTGTFKDSSNSAAAVITGGTTTLGQLKAMLADTGKKLGEIYDITITQAVAGAGGADATADGYVIQNGDTIKLTAKYNGDMKTSSLASGIDGSTSNLTGTVAGKVTFDNYGSDEGNAPAAAGEKSRYTMTFDIDHVGAGQTIKIDDKTFKFYNGGTVPSDTATQINIDLSTLSDGDGDGNHKNEFITLVNSKLLDATNGLNTSHWDVSGQVKDDGKIEIVLETKDGVSGVDNTNLGAGRVTVGGANSGAILVAYDRAGMVDVPQSSGDPFASVTYKDDGIKQLAAGDKIYIGGAVVEIVDNSTTGTLTKTQIKESDAANAANIAKVIEQQKVDGLNFGKIQVDKTAGTITITGTTVGQTGTDLKKAIGEVKFLDKSATSAVASKATNTNTAIQIEAGNTSVGSLATAQLQNGGGKKVGDIFNITVNGSTKDSSYIIQEGDEVKFTANVNGQLDQKIMDNFNYTGDVTNLTAANGWDEGSNATGNKTHYDLTIDLAKVAGGNSFTFGNVNGKSITFDISYDDKSTKNDTVGENDKTDVSNNSGRVTINLYGLSVADAQKEIFDQVKAAMDSAGFSVTSATSGNKVTLSLDAKEEGSEWNYGNIRTSSQSGSFSNAVYKPAGASAGGVEGTHAQVTYKFDVNMLQEGDKLTVGDAVIHVGSETKTENIDGTSKFTVSLADIKANPNEKLVQTLEAAGFKAGQVRFDTNNNTMTITGIETGQKAEDLQKTIGKVSLGSTTRTTMETGGLKLQIGDTADSWNQLQVSINDCHSDAIKFTDDDGTTTALADIDISSQDGASTAMKVIKSAINYISDVRGTLGATQNRLDHTINNLSVMQENIQDAESTIRDVDVAEEMMAYTKNNILVQSAQAMLAQANQVPQGVLQLLQ